MTFRNITILSTVLSLCCLSACQDNKSKNTNAQVQQTTLQPSPKASNIFFQNNNKPTDEAKRMTDLLNKSGKENLIPTERTATAFKQEQ